MWNMLWTVSLMFNFSAAPIPSSFMDPDAGADTIQAAPVDPDHAGFDLRVAGEHVPFNVMAAFVLPGESLPIVVSSLDLGYVAEAEAGALALVGPNQWEWRAPLASGVHRVRVFRDGGESVTLNVFVMVPYDRMKNGHVGHYSIGRYPKPSTNRGAAYDRPRGFVEVTAANDTTRVAPHFRLKQFLCKSGAAYPKYVVLQPSLLVKLERLLETAHDHGVVASTFQLMSAYRTPTYNRRIGNTTSFSRHHYGDAADIFVDERPADGRMDDLNGDGSQTLADAVVLREWAEQLDQQPEAQTGGLSAYGATDTHGPFVHVDVRGNPARW